MAKLTYSERLKDPRWQRKRLEILERDNFECRNCGAKDKTLHVHHGYYRKGADPWDYPGETLETLCVDCHREAEETRSTLYEEIAAGNCTMDFLIGIVRGLRAAQEYEPATVSNHEMACGVGFCFDVSAERIIEALSPDRVLDQDAIFKLDMRESA